MHGLTPVTEGHQSFLFTLYASTRQAEVAAWGWDPAQQEAFLQMQFHAQQNAYARQYPDAEHLVIVQADQPIGRILVAKTASSLLLVDIALLPPFRSAGIGSSLIRQLQAEAVTTEQTIRLHVLRGNRAQRLYERLGFVITKKGETHVAMEWRPT